MPILGGKKSKAAPKLIRVEKVPVPPKPQPRSSLSSSSSARAASSTCENRLGISKSRSSSSRLSPNPPKIKSSGSARPKSASPYPSSSSDERRNKRRKTAANSTPRDSPAYASDTDDSDDGDPFQKRRKVVDDARDPNRKLRHKKAFGDEVRDAKIIHAADLVSVKTGCDPLSLFSSAKEDELAIEMQYPSRSQPERYELVWKKDRINVVQDILRIVKEVAETYLTEAEAKPFIDNTTGFKRQMERASNETIRDIAAFKSALSSYNMTLLSLVENGSIAKNLDQAHQLPPTLVDFILTQVYDRTVAPQSELLNRYQAGSDNVYGELRYEFIRKIIIDHGKMTSDQVFVDLGSGVGNVVLQAALEIGCRSYGCEVVEQSCDFAEAQEVEFNARCRLWGIRPGRVQLERGDFRNNSRILSVLKEADVILVNNKAFGPELNDNLVSMFLDLKTGCKIISLKNFVHGNANSAVNDTANNILDVEEHWYPQDWVSWAASSGEYFVSTKKV